MAAIKTGMLANADIVRAVAHTLKALPSPPPSLVVDPVCVSTSGHTLLEHEALDTLVAELLPLAALLTPNTSEAALLLQHRPRSRRADSWEVNNGQIASVEGMVRASRELCALGPRAVLLKGGDRAHGDTYLADVEAVAANEDLWVHGIECDGWVRHGANMEILFQAAGGGSGGGGAG